MQTGTIQRLLFAGAVALLLTAGGATAEETGTTKSAMSNTSSKNPMEGVKRIVFTGNSLTDGGGWPDWVIETLKANGYPDVMIFNAGVAGNSTAQLKLRYAKDILGLKPDLVVVNVGTVDNKPPEDYRRDLGEMVEATRKTGAKMILMIPAPIRGTNNPSYRSVEYAPVIWELAKTYDCLVVDTLKAFHDGVAAGKEMWGPDGIHHKIEAWRSMARDVLEQLGCHAPLVEKTSLYPNALTDWYIAAPVLWVPATPVILKNMPEDYDPIAAGKGAYPPLPEIPDGFDPLQAGWRKFDRESEMLKTSWWQVSWVARGGIMPLGQELTKEKPGTQSRDSGAYSLAIVHSDKEMQTTMHVGGSLPYAVWLNGKMVWNGNFLHGYHPDADRFTVTLQKGENHILVFCNWLFYVSLGDI